jgi:hypothetical protein
LPTADRNLCFKRILVGAWWCLLVIPALRRLRQEAEGLKTSLSYIAEPVSKTKMNLVF